MFVTTVCFYFLVALPSSQREDSANSERQIPTPPPGKLGRKSNTSFPWCSLLIANQGHPSPQKSEGRWGCPLSEIQCTKSSPLSRLKFGSLSSLPVGTGAETDHQVLQWLTIFHISNSRLTRWSLALQPFKFWVRPWMGCENVNSPGFQRKRRREGC